MTISSPIRGTSFSRLLSVALPLACMALPALSQQVSTDYDHKADLSHLHTFSIYKLQASSPLVEQRLRDDLVQDLTARGLQPVAEGGDVVFTAVGSRGSQQEYQSFYEGLGGGGYGWRGRGFGGFGGGFGNEGVSNTQVVNVPVGSLVIDAYGKDHQLLFRGMSSDTLSGKESKNTKKLAKAVNKIVKAFPSGEGR